jgi:hypothetical protein
MRPSRSPTPAPSAALTAPAPARPAAAPDSAHMPSLDFELAKPTRWPQARPGRGVPPDRRPRRRARPAGGGGRQGRWRAEGQGAGHARPPCLRRGTRPPGAWRWASPTAAPPTTAGSRSPDGRTVQDRVEHALAAFADHAVHHRVRRPHRCRRARAEPGRAPGRAGGARPFSWVRGSNRYLPADIALQWCRRWRALSTPATARAAGATATCCSSRRCGRRWSSGLVGWTFRPLDGEAMRAPPRT